MSLGSTGQIFMFMDKYLFSCASCKKRKKKSNQYIKLLDFMDTSDKIILKGLVNHLIYS